jgi:hypothetical protein
LSIIELGGGFGSLAERLRDKVFHYRIVDLPEMLELQRANIGHVNVRYVEPSVEAFEPWGKDSLFIATFSLSEMDLSDRAELAVVFPKYRYLFFAWNAAFRGIDNDTFFSRLRVMLSMTHETVYIERSERNHRYLLAYRK